MDIPWARGGRRQDGAQDIFRVQAAAQRQDALRKETGRAPPSPDQPYKREYNGLGHTKTAVRRRRGHRSADDAVPGRHYFKEQAEGKTLPGQLRLRGAAPERSGGK